MGRSWYLTGGILPCSIGTISSQSNNCNGGPNCSYEMKLSQDLCVYAVERRVLYACVCAHEEREMEKPAAVILET